MIENRVLTMEPVPETPVVVPSIPADTEPLDTGDLIYVVYWRDIPMPGQPNNGVWDVMSATVISAGKMICCEVHSASTPAWHGGAWESPTGSATRFVKLDRAFRSESAARLAATTLKPK